MFAARANAHYCETLRGTDNRCPFFVGFLAIDLETIVAQRCLSSDYNNMHRGMAQGNYAKKIGDKNGTRKSSKRRCAC